MYVEVLDCDDYQASIVPAKQVSDITTLLMTLLLIQRHSRNGSDDIIEILVTLLFEEMALTLLCYRCSSRDNPLNSDVTNPSI